MLGRQLRPLFTRIFYRSMVSDTTIPATAPEAAPAPVPTMPARDWPLDPRGEPIRRAKARRFGINVSPRKLNLVAKLIRGMSIGEAYRQLAACKKKTAPIVKHAIETAVTNARAFGMKLDRLVVDEAYVGKGRYLKRIRPWHGKGRFGIEHKKYAHLTVFVRELDEELWEYKVLPKYLHFLRSNRKQINDDASHPIHKSSSVSWQSDLDKCLMTTKDRITGLKIALEPDTNPANSAQQAILQAVKPVV